MERNDEDFHEDEGFVPGGIFDESDEDFLFSDEVPCWNCEAPMFHDDWICPNCGSEIL